MVIKGFKIGFKNNKRIYLAFSPKHGKTIPIGRNVCRLVGLTIGGGVPVGGKVQLDVFGKVANQLAVTGVVAGVVQLDAE